VDVQPNGRVGSESTLTPDLPLPLRPSRSRENCL
jgi:hypothetical protein